MNIAKVSTNGQLTLPAEIRKLLDVKAGDKVLFIRKDNGDIVVKNAAMVFVNDELKSEEV